MNTITRSYYPVNKMLEQPYEDNFELDSTEELISPPLSLDEVTSEELSQSFEAIRRELACLMILIKRSTREHHDKYADHLDIAQQLATAQHAATYRTNVLIFMTAAKCLLEATSVLAIAFPPVPMAGCEALNNWAGFDVFSIGRFNGDLNEFSDDAAKFFQSFANVTETLKQLYETRHAGDRTEIAALETRIKSFLERRHQDISHATRDEAEALEALRQMLDQLSSARSKMCQ